MAKITFINDTDKMYDFLTMTKSEFLKSYSYLTQEEYMNTYYVFMNNIVGCLADLMRTAENLLLEESNGRETFVNVTGEQLKTAISNYVNEKLSSVNQVEFQ